MAVKHKPERSCVVCRQRFNKKELLRHIAVLPPAQTVAGLTPDLHQTAPGRGFYCCRSAICARHFERYQNWRKKVKEVNHEHN